jgi:ribonuclease HI
LRNRYNTNQSTEKCNYSKPLGARSVGAGGALHDLRGTLAISFAWGLSQLSNNLVEAYALLCGLTLAKEKNVRALSILGDSMIIIKIMIEKSNLDGHKLKNFIVRIKQKAISFAKASYYHIKRDLNE